MAFKYEKNLPHQEVAINSVVSALQDLPYIENSLDNFANKIEIDLSQLKNNLESIQVENDINDQPLTGNSIIDISMETGTGKTYTYTKTMYELYRNYGIFKFVVVVPTLSIKAGTESFLKSEALMRHFRLDFEGIYGDTQVKLYVVQSQKAKKGKRQHNLIEVHDFVSTNDKSKIHVLLINQGMINSDSMSGKLSDGSQLFAHEFDNPFKAIASTRPVLIIDEPHKFAKAKTTWKNIEKFQSILTLRYGATFTEYENLIYRLTAVQAFNDNLVKGVNVFVEELEGDDGVVVTLEKAKSEEVEFRVSNSKKSILVRQGDSLGLVHSNLHDIWLEKAKATEVILSNGLSLKKGDKINPFAYSDTVINKMLRNAIRTHFDTEKALLTRENGRIKPLTLFFIDDIKGYREGREEQNSLLNRFELFVKAEVESRLAYETNDFYKAYLEKALEDISATHEGYFAQDNSESDEKIEQEIREILHDKEGLLSLDNPRRFIFSKWTLREGWDNPNVFGICKLRLSGSEISKLQEVGRGLRLPVNEFMARVNQENFYLNYFVDSRENDFVNKLVGEVNSQVPSIKIPKIFTNELANRISQSYSDKPILKIFNEALNAGFINDNDEFIDNHGNVSSEGFYKLRDLYPLALKQELVDVNKIRNGKEAKKKKIKMRIAKYAELKNLWESINQKVILNYKIESEEEFLNLFVKFLESDLSSFKQSGSITVKSNIRVQNDLLVANKEQSIEEINFEPIAMMSYSTFLLKLAEKILIQRNTLHRAFLKVANLIDIRLFLNQQTINGLARKFNRWLLLNSFTSFEVGYSHTSNEIHPTKFTNKLGDPLEEVEDNIFDGELSDDEPLPQFLFDRVFFNSDLEKENITESEVKEVIVFTKIPKNSIKIPVAGGGTYSPDFAYVVKTSSGDILNFIIETKGVSDDGSLRVEEKKKIEHAERLFEKVSTETKVIFTTQFQGDKIAKILKAVCK
ncbi:type III restriction-modification system endonuclease [Psittacicella gerlachiana]|nr:type III restriction-modification system endonuclease [Psittacicella gerlachiana]